MAQDEDALVCDLAEAYGVINWRALPVDTVAALACGLGNNSRTKLRESGLGVDINTLLLACVVDKLNILVWQNTKDGAKGRNKPKSFAEVLVGGNKKDNEIAAFDTAEEFEAALRKFNGTGESICADNPVS